MKRFLLPLLALMGCSGESILSATIEQPLSSVRAGGADHSACFCLSGRGWCNQLFCRWKVYPELLAESQGNSDTFDVGIDCRDYRKIYLVGNQWAPIDRSVFGITYDPAMIELLNIDFGVDNAHWPDVWESSVEPYVDDPSLNLILAVKIAGVESTYVTQSQIFPETYYPPLDGYFQTYRFLRLTFKQIAQQGETSIKIVRLYDPMRFFGYVEPLKLILSPIPPTRNEAEF